jgi:hypothetical protein
MMVGQETGDMMLTITLPPEIESRLKCEAKRNGIDASDYASKLIAEHLPPQALHPDGNGDDEEVSQRGTTPLDLTRETLFVQSQSVPSGDLPRWKPQVTLTRRVLAESDDV